ncbi:hypothetical protein RSAG8_13938, partial [Rhizoctonia solani AG-8 WAC10335]
ARASASFPPTSYSPAYIRLLLTHHLAPGVLNLCVEWCSCMSPPNRVLLRLAPWL